MEFILSALGFIVLCSFALWAFSKYEKRWAGIRLFFKGAIRFGVGGVFIGLGEVLGPPLLKTFGLIVFLVGFVLCAKGMGTHWKRTFLTTDPKAEIDPGYDLEYVLCPNCKGVKVRLDARPFKCPICKKKIKRPASNHSIKTDGK